MARKKDYIIDFKMRQDYNDASARGDLAKLFSSISGIVSSNYVAISQAYIKKLISFCVLHCKNILVAVND